MTAGYSSREIAAALGVSERAWQLKAKALVLPFTEQRAGRALVRRWNAVTLPEPIRAKLAGPNGKKNAVASVPDLASLKSHQRARLEARASILALVDHYVTIEGMSRAQAVGRIVADAQARCLPPVLQGQLAIANARGNGARTLCRATIFNWLQARDRAGGDLGALASAASAAAPIPAFAATFLALYGRPNKPGIGEVLARWPASEPKPSYDQARRFLKRLSAIDRNRGRMGPRALRALQAYIVRGVENLWPGAVFIGDGHTYKAEVAHPDHGRPFRPEITAILDVYTRRWVGWSAALAENTWSVADALRHAVTASTCCDVFYYDNGAGAKNATWDTDATGLAARLGITKLHSAPWSSQARGIIERFNATVLHTSARQLPTYVGARMDKEARQVAFNLTRRALRDRGASPLLLAWPAFLERIEQDRLAYNARPHSFLPRIADPVTGKRRPQSPDEAWQAAIAVGWRPDPIGAAEARDLFRPHERRIVSRATVSLYGNLYFAPELEPLHGDTVIVGYDIHDPARVQVRLGDGRFVCDAIWNGNKRDYLPVSFVEHARQKRLQGRLNRLDAHRAEAIAEGAPNLRLVATPAEPTPDEIAAQAAFEERFTATAPALSAAEREELASKQRYIRALAVERAGDAGAAVSEIDGAWYRGYATTAEYLSWRNHYELYGDSVLEA